MKHIYETKGAAQEYAPLSLSHYIGCDHGCSYCYAPKTLHVTRPVFDAVRVKKGATDEATFLDRVEQDAKETREAGAVGPVLLCFSGDPYPAMDDDLRLTRGIIKAINRGGLPVAVLTKAGKRSERDLDVLSDAPAGPDGKPLQNEYAITLTGRDDLEPRAASSEERIRSLEIARSAGLRTWVSFEPVLDTGSLTSLMAEVAPLVDFIRVGLLNHMKIEGVDVDPREVMDLVESFGAPEFGKPVYVKSSLMKASSRGAHGEWIIVRDVERKGA